jgi:hypothetical protein
MNKYLENYYSLFSLDKQVVYRALLDKKDWLFQPFLVELDFHQEILNDKVVYPCLFSLLDGSLEFNKLNISKDLFDEENISKINVIEGKFNANYRLLYLYLHVNKNYQEGHFYAQMDFNKIDNHIYKELFPNLFHCFASRDELDLFYNENNEVDVLKYGMYNLNNDAHVLILDKSKLLGNKCYLPYYSKIIYVNHKLTKEQIEALQEISSSLKIPLEVIYE